MALRGVNHITLCVADLPRAVGFYQGVLGATLKRAWSKGAYLELGDLWLCLEVTAVVTQRADDSHIALDCSADEFDVMSARIGNVAQEWKQNRSEGASLYFLDPDGHKLELHVGTLQDRLNHYAQGDT